MAKLEYIEGIGKANANKLNKAGIRSTTALFKKGAEPAGRKEIAKESGISPKLILEWVNHLDLMRIKGVGSEFADLLEEAGVDTVVELSKRKPANLHEAMVKTNNKNKNKLVRRQPSEELIVKWVEQAKKLPRGIKY